MSLSQISSLISDFSRFLDTKLAKWLPSIWCFEASGALLEPCHGLKPRGKGGKIGKGTRKWPIWTFPPFSLAKLPKRFGPREDEHPKPAPVHLLPRHFRKFTNWPTCWARKGNEWIGLWRTSNMKFPWIFQVWCSCCNWFWAAQNWNSTMMQFESHCSFTCYISGLSYHCHANHNYIQSPIVVLTSSSSSSSSTATSIHWTH